MPTKTEMNLNDLPDLIEDGIISEPSYLKAVEFLRDAELWKKWATVALFAVAIGHILSGVIFFFAFNWNNLSGMTKFAIVGAGIISCLIAWIITKLDSPKSQAFGIAATVLVGVMFAVLGQVYQTPALIHTPFVFWALLTLPFALASKNVAHWTVWIAILVVAIATYANSGLRLAGNHYGANILNIAVSAGFIAALILRDKVLAPKFDWIRADWFRLLLVLGAVVFALAGFCESLWGGSRHFLWLISLGLVIGLCVYLYYKAPSLGTLALATVSGFLSFAQLGLKLIIELGVESYDALLFLGFILLAFLTVILVKIFRHYISNFKADANKSLRVEPSHIDAQHKISAQEFSDHMNLDSSVVDKHMATTARKSPWYMTVFLAFAGILTAIVGTAFLAAFIGSFEVENFGIVGILIFIGAIFFRRKSTTEYSQHLANTMIIIGGVVATLGLGLSLTAKTDIGIIIIGLILSIITLLFVKDRILEFLSAAAIISFPAYKLYDSYFLYTDSLILVIATAAGLFCLTRPIGKRLYSAAGTAFLLAPIILGIRTLQTSHVPGGIASVSYFDNITARITSLIVLLAAVAYMNKGRAFKDYKPPLMVIIPLVLAAACVPLGGNSALLLMLLGYMLGSRSLAIISSLLLIYFLTMFYYEIGLTLLTKSIILFITGLIFLGVWLFINRSQEAAS